ncbi:DUF1801 domain-containing protein [Terrabacter sp. NPDC000476]|uniref:DUF1801 domain-containing protein n=1 Tax=Terrabacter sp. NPDC000476 TaxID=3154258 RepID=UPI00331E6146
MKPRFHDVAAFLDALDPPRREVVDALCATIRDAQPGLDELIKWNSPSYAWGELDLFTVNVQNRQQQVQLVLHLGTARAEQRGRPPVLGDDEGLVRWLSDIRGVILFPDLTFLRQNQAALERVLERWTALAGSLP